MWDSVLKLGKSLSLPLSLGAGQRKEGPALRWFPWCNPPQRLPGWPQPSLTCFFLPLLPCSLHGGGGEGGDWSVEGPGPLQGNRAVPGVSPQPGWAGALKLPVAGLQPLHEAWHSAEVGRGQVGADGPRKGQWQPGNSGPGLTSPLTWGTPLPSLSLSVLTGVEESPLFLPFTVWPGWWDL